MNNIKLIKKMATKNNSPLTICVYCGAASDVDSIYKEVAKECGAALAMAGIRVVYGGGNVGLMGLVADSALKAGGEVIGIIPAHIEKREPQHLGLTELHVVESMHDRKAFMEKISDGFIILPGGLGTMDETFEILTWKVLGLHKKPIAVVNTNNYWEHFIKLVNDMVKKGFASDRDRGYFSIFDNIADSIDFIKNTN